MIEARRTDDATLFGAALRPIVQRALDARAEWLSCFQVTRARPDLAATEAHRLLTRTATVCGAQIRAARSELEGLRAPSTCAAMYRGVDGWMEAYARALSRASELATRMPPDRTLRSIVVEDSQVVVELAVAASAQ